MGQVSTKVTKTTTISTTIRLNRREIEEALTEYLKARVTLEHVNSLSFSFADESHRCYINNVEITAASVTTEEFPS